MLLKKKYSTNTVTYMYVDPGTTFDLYNTLETNQYLSILLTSPDGLPNSNTFSV